MESRRKEQRCEHVHYSPAQQALRQLTSSNYAAMDSLRCARGPLAGALELSMPQQ